jgi:hypothetical protein
LVVDVHAAALKLPGVGMITKAAALHQGRDLDDHDLVLADGALGAGGDRGLVGITERVLGGRVGSSERWFMRVFVRAQKIRERKRGREEESEGESEGKSEGERKKYVCVCVYVRVGVCK